MIYDPPEFDASQTVKKVKNMGGDVYEITGSGGWSFCLDKKHDITPKVGDHYQLRTKGFSQIVGIKWGNRVLFNKTVDEVKSEHQEFCRKQREEKQAEFKKNCKKQDTQYEALPEVFRRRVDKFRDNNPDFRWEYEPYELFCCEQAIGMAKHFKTREALIKFNEMEYKDQKKTWKGFSDEHSGNTFVMSVKLAILYLNDPENVVKFHGALAPLVGSKEYGCVPKDSEES